MIPANLRVPRDKTTIDSSNGESHFTFYKM